MVGYIRGVCYPGGRGLYVLVNYYHKLLIFPGKYLNNCDEVKYFETLIQLKHFVVLFYTTLSCK